MTVAGWLTGAEKQAMDLKGKQVEVFRNALTHAFRSPVELEMMVRIELNERLNDIVAPGNLTQMAFALVNWAEQSEDGVERLLHGALAQRSGNPRLRLLAQELALTSDMPPESGGKIEAIALEGVPIPDVQSWRERMASVERRVCRVEIPKLWGRGTGFLVGPNFVLTNWHVASWIEKQGVAPESVGLRFDYALGMDGNLLEGPTYSLAQDWKADWSPETELDYALLRVDGHPGDEVIDPRTGNRREWLTPARHQVAVGEPALIVQHPLADTLKLGVGAVQRIDMQQKRITYTTNTQPGSSGSPVFTLAWELVAIHHFGATTGNRGIPLDAIWDLFRNKPFYSELAPD